jgi:hypothetical protein
MSKAPKNPRKNCIIYKNSSIVKRKKRIKQTKKQRNKIPTTIFFQESNYVKTKIIKKTIC